MSSPAMLGIKEHRDSIRDYQRAQSAMQFYNYQGDGTIHKKQYTGKQWLRLDVSPLSGAVSPQRTGPLGSTIASLLAGPRRSTQGGECSGASRQTAARHQRLPTRPLVGGGGAAGCVHCGLRSLYARRFTFSQVEILEFSQKDEAAVKISRVNGRAAAGSSCHRCSASCFSSHHAESLPDPECQIVLFGFVLKYKTQQTELSI